MSEQPVALVTGASRGIGRAVCEQLLRSGRRVVASARDPGRLARLAQEVGSSALALVAADLSQAGAAASVVEQAQHVWGRLDELVTSAGVVRYEAATETTDAALREQLELNFLVPYQMAQRAAASMCVQPTGGSIVFIASTLGMRSAPLTSAYAASKAALISAARSFALELAPRVRVNAVAPGVIDTDMIRVARGGPHAPEEERTVIAGQLEALRALHPLGRLGSAGDVAAAVLYLLGAPWVTGSVLTVDGGLTAA